MNMHAKSEIEAIAVKPVLTVQEAALLAGVSQWLLYKKWRRGEGPAFIKIGRLRRVQRKALDAWLAGMKGASDGRPYP